MAVPKRRTSTTRKKKRRTHLGLKLPNMNECPKCGEMKRNHHVCPSCGYYGGDKIIEKNA